MKYAISNEGGGEYREPEMTQTGSDLDENRQSQNNLDDETKRLLVSIRASIASLVPYLQGPWKQNMMSVQTQISETLDRRTR